MACDYNRELLSDGPQPSEPDVGEVIGEHKMLLHELEHMSDAEHYELLPYWIKDCGPTREQEIEYHRNQIQQLLGS